MAVCSAKSKDPWRHGETIFLMPPFIIKFHNIRGFFFQTPVGAAVKIDILRKAWYSDKVR